MFRIAGAVLVLAVSSPPAVTEAPAARMLARLAALAGDWEGTFQWSGARTGGGPLRVTYSVTGNGSAVLETLIQGGVPTMASVYHLDGADLRVTHFCGARNQPRLKARRIDEAAGAIDFAFVDVTGVGPGNPGHVEGLELRLTDDDRMTIRFVFGGGVPRAVEDIHVRRVAAAAARSL